MYYRLLLSNITGPTSSIRPYVIRTLGAREQHTLIDPQHHNIINLSSMRKNTQHDQTIIHVSFLSRPLATEIAALVIGDVYEERDKLRNQSIVRDAQTKGAYARTIAARDSRDPLFMMQMRISFNAIRMCQKFLQIYKDYGLKGAISHSKRRTFITRLASASINVRLL